MAIDYSPPSPKSDSSAEETQANQESQRKEAAKNETPVEVFYKTKKIEFRGQTKRIILQDKNGPCPLIAMCNVLILRGEINLDMDSFEVSQESLLNHVAEILFDRNDDEYIDVELLRCLAKGIDIDLKFNSIKDFEVTPELALFGSLKIPLYHGWLVHPQDLEIATAIGGRSYDALTSGLAALDLETQTVKARSSKKHGKLGKGDIEKEGALLKALTLSEREAPGFDTHRDSNEGEAVSGSSDVNGLTREESKVIKEFLKDSASQLTWHGLFTLEDKLKKEELCVLYRNNHFSTMLKHDDKLFTLVTDQGYLMEQDLVWERLNQTINLKKQFPNSSDHRREPSLMAIDYSPPSPKSDSPVEETMTNQESQQKEAAKNEIPVKVFYKTKKIEFRGQTKVIILQDKNGPCPLIAMCNVLILRGEINLDKDSFEVSQESLLNHVAEILFDRNDDEYIDAELLKCLAKGIAVDLKFNSIKDFEDTPELAIFGSLKIPLYHGWLVHPQDLEIATAIGGRSYIALTIGLAALDLDTQTVKARSGQSSGECSVDFAASITATPPADSPPASAEHRGFGKGDIEEEETLLKALTLSKREALLKGSFDTHRDSNEVVSGSSDVNQISEDDILVTSVDAAAGCTITLGSNICQQSKFDDQFSSAESEDRTDCDVGNKINVGEEACSTTSITKSSEAYDHDQLSSTEMGDETVGVVEAENSSKMTAVHVNSSEAPISVKKTNLESTKNDIISEVPLKSEAITFVNADLSGKSQDDDVSLSESEECVSLGSPVYYEGELLLGQNSSEGNDTNGLTREEGIVIKEFLKDSASQLTWHGLCTLEDDLKDEELCILYRNNHFSTMLKHDDKLFTLVTDQGYLMEQDLVWERLNQINGDSVFHTGIFKVFKSDSDKSRKRDQQHAINKTENVISGIYSEYMDDNDPDLQMAKELQRQVWAGDTGSEVPIISSNHIPSSIQVLKEVLRWQNGQSCI